MSWETEHEKHFRNCYNKQNYDRYTLIFPKGKKAEYKALADRLGITLNALINQMLEERLINNKIEAQAEE